MRRALTILLVALGGFLTAFIGGSAAAGALELPGTGHLDGLISSLDQSQSGTVDNTTDQTSKATVDNQQSNVYVPISILSPSSGDSSVEQGNQASNRADSATVNGTEQMVDQDQAGTATTTDESRGSGWSRSGSGTEAVVDQTQTGTVGNDTTQSSEATVDNDQSNVYVPISILSPSSGDSSVEQGNQASNRADSATVNGTWQDLGQSQTGTAGAMDDSHDHPWGGWSDGWKGDSWKGGAKAPSGGSDTRADVGQTQAGTVENHTDQESKATVDNEQSNAVEPVSFLSPSAGDHHVVQGNQASNHADSVAVNGTWQDLGQTQDGAAEATDGHTTGWSSWWDHHGDEWDHSEPC